MQGIKITFIIFLSSSLFSLMLGTVIAVSRISRIRILQIAGKAYVKIFQSIPLLFWLLFFYYVFPEMLPFGLRDSFHEYFYYPVAASILALTLDNAAYVSDILKSGRILIPHTQREAAIAAGLGRLQQYTCVLLPQIFRLTLPALGTRMVHNFKNTTLCMVITAHELIWATQQIESLTFRGVETVIAATAFYIAVAISMAALVIIIERHLKIDAASINRSRA